MSQYLYTYAARGIQDYVLRGDKLKEMVGASELIEDLSTTGLNQTLEALRLPHTIVSQAAGAARILFNSKEDASTLALVWPMIVCQKAPGLQVVQAIVEADTNIFAAVANAEMQMAVERSIVYADLPAAGAFARRCPRTGKPAVAFADKEPIDAEARAKRQCPSRERIVRILDPNETLRWPDDFSQIAGRDNAYVAIVHADGNAFGRMFIRLQHASQKVPISTDVYAALCRRITEITQSAARKAVEQTCLSASHWPGRVLILAGDDLTAVVRADLSIDFARVFLCEFSKISREHLAQLNNNKTYPLPEELSASAGITFIKKSYPFIQAYHLAESLCKFAKDPFRDYDTAPAALAFHRITTSTSSNNFKDIVKNELTASDVCLTMMPYVVHTNDSSAHSTLDQLKALAESARNLPRGKLRTLLTDFYESTAKVERDFQRMVAVARESGKGSGSNTSVDKFCHALRDLTGAELVATSRKSPIADIITLAQIKRAEERRATEEHSDKD